MDIKHNELLDRAFLFADKTAQRLFINMDDASLSGDSYVELNVLRRALEAAERREHSTVVEVLYGNSEQSPLVFLHYPVHAAAMCSRAYQHLHLFHEGLQCLEDVRSLANRPVEQLTVAWQKGCILRNLRRIPESMSELVVAHAHATELELTEIAAYVYAEMASATMSAGDGIKAAMMYEQSLLALSTSTSALEYITRIRINLASVYQGLGRDADALREYEKYQSENVGDVGTELYAVVQLNMAIAQRRLGHYADACTSYLAVLDFATSHARKGLQIRSHTGLAYLSVEMADLVQGRAHAQEAILIATEFTGESLLEEALVAMASVERHEGSSEAAIATYQEVFRMLVNAANTGRAVQIGAELVEWLIEDERFRDAVLVQQECSRLQAAVYERDIERTVEITKARTQLDSDRENLRTREEERNKVLQSVLPMHIAERLMNGESHIADRVPDVTIMFADIVGFTTLAAQTEPEELVRFLEELFRAFDVICSKHDCERIKTIGDSYMAISTASHDAHQQTENLVRVALEIVTGGWHLPIGPERLRVGIHCGPVIAGVMSGDRLSYDIWGDTVNVAARMEHHSQPGRILCTTEVAQRISKLSNIELTEREPIDVRGKGSMITYWVSARSV